MVNWHKFFTSILDTISDGVFISDAMGTTLYVNQMYADLVGVPARDLRGKNVRDLVSEGFFDLALNPEVVRTGKPATYMQKLKDGKNVVISGAPVFDDKGRVCLVVTFVRDETRLAELNEQTGEQRKLIKEINDKLAFGFSVPGTHNFPMQFFEAKYVITCDPFPQTYAGSGEMSIKLNERFLAAKDDAFTFEQSFDMGNGATFTIWRRTAAPTRAEVEYYLSAFAAEDAQYPEMFSQVAESWLAGHGL